MINAMRFKFLEKSNHKQPSLLRFSSMAPPSLSSLLSHTQHSPFLSPPPNPNLTNRHTLNRPTISFSTKNENTSSKKDSINKIKYPPPPALQTAPTQERKSVAVATGELFLGIASRFVKPQDRKSISSSSDENVSGLSLLERKSNGVGVDEEDNIGAIMEDDVQPEVIWEQRVKDIEAEKERPVITSPGFSFSAAGLLFPYHLGVSQLLIERGYIKETTPLAGSSAGAIVCVVVASGATMQEALIATKVLAQNCRLNGTAFRLGVLDAQAFLDDRPQLDIEGDREKNPARRPEALDLGLLGLGSFRASKIKCHEAQVLGPTRLFAQLTLQERIFSLEDTRTRVS